MKPKATSVLQWLLPAMLKPQRLLKLLAHTKRRSQNGHRWCWPWTPQKQRLASQMFWMIRHHQAPEMLSPPPVRSSTDPVWWKRSRSKSITLAVGYLSCHLRLQELNERTSGPEWPSVRLPSSSRISICSTSSSHFNAASWTSMTLLRSG